MCVCVGGSGRCALVNISCMDGAVGQGRANDIIHRERKREREGTGGDCEHSIMLVLGGRTA